VSAVLVISSTGHVATHIAGLCNVQHDKRNKVILEISDEHTVLT